MTDMTAPQKSAEGMSCPVCGSADTVHSAWLYQEWPDSVRLETPVEILRCRCREWFRADGQPYDELRRRAVWAEFREDNAKRTIWP